MEEQWKPIDDTEGKYQVSNLGRVKGPRGILSTYTQLPKGYVYVNLCLNGKQTCRRLSRIVATAFCKKQDGCNEVDHLDANKQNNAASNLQWVTHSENVKRALYKESLYLAPQYKPKPVVVIKGDLRIPFLSIADAARYMGVTRISASKACRNNRKCKGFSIRYDPL